MSPDTLALQALLNAGGGQLEARTYYVDAPLEAPVAFELRGVWGKTRIEATAPVDYLLGVRAQSRLEDVAFAGCGVPYGAVRYATDGLRCTQAAYSTWRRCAFQGFQRDGVRLEAGNNDGMYVEQCQFGGNGFVFTTEATAPQTAGFMTKPALGAHVAGGVLVADAVPKWLRPGCPVRLGAAYHVVQAIDSAGIHLNPAPADGPVATWAAGVGCGWWEERSGDNGMCNLVSCLFRNNAEAGLVLDGLYGHAVTACQFDYNSFYAVRISTNESNPVIGSAFVRCYFESNPAGALLVGGAPGLSIVSPLYDDLPTALTFQSDSAANLASALLPGGQYRKAGAAASFTIAPGGLQSPTVHGPLALDSKLLNRTSPTFFEAGTTVPGATLIILDPSDGDIVLTGSPAFSHPPGPLVVQCKMGQPHSVTLPGFLPGYWAPSGIQLKAGGARVLTQGQMAFFWSDGAHLWEVA